MKQTGVVLCVLAPHPPLLIPEIGKRDINAVKTTAEAMDEMARRVNQSEPDVIIVISPHAPLFHDVIAILVDDPLSGDFSGFGVSEARYSFWNDLELANAIMDEAAQIGVRVHKFSLQGKERYGTPTGLDHGVLVPMHFLGKEVGQDIPIVVMGTALLSRDELYDLGKAIDKAAQRLRRRAVLVASGDLSHRLTRDAPAGYSVRGREFDEKLMQLIRETDIQGILSLDDSLLEQAGECGYRPVVTALGALDGDDLRSEVLSYEGPFGVGYGCALFGPEIESLPAKLARAAVETYVKHGKTIDPPEDVPQEFLRQAGVFCTLKTDGELRGCIGTIESTSGSIAEEIIGNAIAAATSDPRFFPVREDELSSLSYSVDVLMPCEHVRDLDELDPKSYGVVVRKGRRRGLLLPDIEGVDTPWEQVSIAKRKAGIGQNEEVELERFKVKRYT